MWSLLTTTMRSGFFATMRRPTSRIPATNGQQTASRKSMRRPSVTLVLALGAGAVVVIAIGLPRLFRNVEHPEDVAIDHGTVVVQA